ncbi:MAG: DUF362 domain-containing protein [Prolixibacteraceae bacterium]|jgi:uncharacterized protein (DUF362 family)|nr:DUF362 domain-containing protein [Prolixibacteraceae bacterium]
MKTNKSNWHKYRWVIIFFIAVAAISFDFALTSIQAIDGTFKPESEFQKFTYSNTKVSVVTSEYEGLTKQISRNIDPDYQQVEDMVRKAIELQGGLEGTINKNDVVMLKINLVGANSASGNGENTDVRVIKALMKVIHKFTDGEVEFWIAEGSARSNDDINSAGSVWANSGYQSLLSDNELSDVNFKLLNINQSIDDIIEYDLGDIGVNAYQGSKYFVHKSLFEADVYITVPVLKVHNTGITSALKLQIGIAPGAVYGYNKLKGTTYSPPLYHDVKHRRWTTEAIVDLSNIAQIDFVVVDALMCLDLGKSDKVDNRVRFNTILAGSDPVAIDHVCTRLFDMNPDDIAHITLAEKVGLGTNNPEQIEITGEDIEQVKKRIRRNQETNGLFGQSNRTWILSNAFSSTNINDELIANEMSVSPKPGDDGWSQPVYFFDDRIDLLNYYSAATNIISYAYTSFYTPEAQQAELWLGTHEAIKVYMNGETVYESNTTNNYGDSEIGKRVAYIDLLEGKNTLMVKTLNKFGDYSFALNICEVESVKFYAGNRVEGLKFFQNEKGLRSPDINNSKQNIKVYPNPASDFVKLTFDLNNAQNSIIDIYNLKGQKVKAFRNLNHPQSQNTIFWDLTNDKGFRLDNGIYICTLTNGVKQHSVRLIIK